MPGRLTSKVYFARPLTLSGPSSRFTCEPTTVAGVAGQLYLGSTGGTGGRPPCGACGAAAARSRSLATLHPFDAGDRLKNPVERATTADVAVEPFLDLIRRRVGIFLEQADAGHDEARRTEAAHQRILLAERLLHGMEPAVGRRETVDVADALALHVDGERRAGVDRPAVDEHRAGAAG